MSEDPYRELLADLKVSLAWALQATSMAQLVFGEPTMIELVRRVQDTWPEDFTPGYRQLEHDCMNWVRGIEMPAPFTDLVPHAPVMHYRPIATVELPEL